jgi:hypothetical protein
MAERDDNVIPFPSRTRHDGGSFPSAESMRTTVEHLDNLNRCLDEMAPAPTWSPEAWRVQSIQLRMSLSRVRGLLRVFDRIQPWDWTDGIGRVLALMDGRADLERRLAGMDACLQLLLDPSASTADRTQRAGAFRKRARELSRAIDVMGQLILEAYPPVTVRR